MEGMDWTLLGREMLHSSPFFGVMLFMAYHFVVKYQKTMDKMEDSIQRIEVRLAGADLPSLKQEVKDLHEGLNRVKEQIFILGHKIKI